MTFSYFTADQIFDGFQFFKNKVLVTRMEGTVEAIIDEEDAPEDVLHCDGLLCPGLINTHCHLELSHMRGQLPERTGLIPFIKGVLQKRESTNEIIQEAIHQADREMSENGIVAVGDISNVSDSFKTKSESNIHYHTFVEVFNLDPQLANITFQTGVDLIVQLDELGLSGSMAPHAPYTVSPDLFRLIGDFNSTRIPITSLHNQETQAEDEFFQNGTGLFNDFYRDWGMDISFFYPTGLGSLPSSLPHLHKKGKTLLVHNTFSKHGDIELANSCLEEVFWCSNPNANLYIENILPNYDNFRKSGVKITLGTDSLASNWQLSILEEINIIQKHRPELPLEELLTWATLNGAKALGIDHWAGSFKKGKKPGVLNLKFAAASTNNLSNQLTRLI